MQTRNLKRIILPIAGVLLTTWIGVALQQGFAVHGIGSALILGVD